MGAKNAVAKAIFAANLNKDNIFLLKKLNRFSKIVSLI